MQYRYSTNMDVDDVDALLKLCFGDRSKCGALYNIENRYLLAYDNDRLVAMTGLCKEDVSAFNGREIDWTCCHPDYRKQGIMTHMFEQLLNDVHSDVYCSCWREPCKDRANLHSIVTQFGFHCVGKGYKSFNSVYHTACYFCNIKKDECVCYEDLYFRKGDA